MASDQPIKLCECGCGQPTAIASATDLSRGHVKGQPMRYVRFHHSARKPRDLWVRITSHCVQDGDCLVWQGEMALGGYGRIRIGRKGVLVHRAAYEYFNGPIPKGLTIDHVKARGCRFRACCNVAHLEAVTFRENVFRGTSLAVTHAAATHCPSGHEYNEQNTRLYQGRRYCRACAVIRGKRRYTR